jgi:hypothetical protein
MGLFFNGSAIGREAGVDPGCQGEESHEAIKLMGRQGPGGSTLEANQTSLRDFGHFCAEVPKSLHIGAHPRVFSMRGRLPRGHKTPTIGILLTARRRRRA